MSHFTKPSTTDCYICPDCGKYVMVKSEPIKFEISGVYGKSGIAIPFDRDNPENGLCDFFPDQEHLPQTSMVYEPRFWCDACEQEMPQVDYDIFKLVRAFIHQKAMTRYSCAGHPEDVHVCDRADDILCMESHGRRDLAEVEDSFIITSYIDFLRDSRSIYIIHKAAMMAFEKHRSEHRDKACRFHWHIFPATTRYGVCQRTEPLSEFAIWYDAKDMSENERMEVYEDVKDFMNIMADTLFNTVFGENLSNVIGHTGDSN